ncbi:MAG: formylglycine-generating enzyme family protein, partial [Deltaproteobacteria bacterium]|nr:formylglycine-generating enzyme family protein [Deltaproteobacteria bacterium]
PLHTVQNCSDGLPRTCDPMQGATAEVCNGIDDDCDDVVDNGLGTTTCGSGACLHTVQNCSDGLPQTCDPKQGATTEVCDGTDNDCDGEADEGNPCPARQGCVNGHCTCEPGYEFVPAGTFTMGSPLDEPGRSPYGPLEAQHKVTISRGLCLKATEVTEDEWQTLMGYAPPFKQCGACPVVHISWWEALAYCNAMSIARSLQPCYDMSSCTGIPGTLDFECPSDIPFAGLSCTGYRLPTEAEWEYSARSGTTSGTYNGTSPVVDCTQPNPVLDSIAWFQGNSGTKAPRPDCKDNPSCITHPMKGKQPNAWGLYDMLGNVEEWVWDWYSSYSTQPVTDPLGGPASGTDRVARGGHYLSNAGQVRAASRSLGSSQSPFIGMRPAKTVPTPPECDDSDPCTLDTFDPATGQCGHLNQC